MTSIHEAEPVVPEPVHPRDSRQIQKDEKIPESPPENPPVEPETGKILDTYA